MAEVVVEIAGRRYRMACDDGEEAHLRNLAHQIDIEAQRLEKTLTQPPSEARLMLMAGLMVADKLKEAETAIERLKAENVSLTAQMAENRDPARPAPKPASQPAGGDLFGQEYELRRSARITAVAERMEGLTDILTRG